MKRQIGVIGIAARMIIGTWLAGSDLYGHVVHGPFRPFPWVIGLVIFQRCSSPGSGHALATT